MQNLRLCFAKRKNLEKSEKITKNDK